VPDWFVEQVVRVMQMADWHTYQVLTKRADHMRDMLRGQLASAAKLSHIWWGVSVEDRKYGVPRIEALREAPAAIKFLSIEPLLEDLGELNLEGIHWVIVGGESGAGARPMDESWVLSIRAQCEAAGVPFFFKQWGGVRKGEAGRKLQGRTYDEMPARGKKSRNSGTRRELIEEVNRWNAGERRKESTKAVESTGIQEQNLLF
jgi:protein gp37